MPATISFRKKEKCDRAAMRQERTLSPRRNLNIQGLGVPNVCFAALCERSAQPLLTPASSPLTRGLVLTSPSVENFDPPAEHHRAQARADRKQVDAAGIGDDRPPIDHERQPPA